MRKWMLILLVMLLCSCRGAEEQTLYPEGGIAIIGASFAYSENGWFEIACERLEREPINKAVSGENIIHNALRFRDKTQFTDAEMDSFATFVIMHTHNINAYGEEGGELSENPTIAEAYDYVIRTYISLCRELEFNPASVWYGVAGGKPVDIVLCTHWHDAREVFNTSVRLLAERWKGYARLCEFDKNIGFTKDVPDPITGKQRSIDFAHPGNGATEIIDGVEYGWHPKRGRDSEIQQRMADIFCKCF